MIFLNTPRFLLQAGSTFFLAGAILFFFPGGIDRAFFLGCVANFVISFWYHGLQRPYYNKDNNDTTTLFSTTTNKKENHHYPEKRQKKDETTTLSSSWLYHYSSIDVSILWPDLTLRRLDRTFVNFICLYTGIACDDYYYHYYSDDNNDSSSNTSNAATMIPLPFVLLIMSAVAGCRGGLLHFSTIGYALYLTIFHSGGFLSSSSSPEGPLLTLEWRIAFLIASLTGILIFLRTEQLGAWCTPYRYTWHLCCSIITATASQLHHAKRQ